MITHVGCRRLHDITFFLPWTDMQCISVHGRKKFLNLHGSITGWSKPIWFDPSKPFSPTHHLTAAQLPSQIGEALIRNTFQIKSWNIEHFGSGEDSKLGSFYVISILHDQLWCCWIYWLYHCIGASGLWSQSGCFNVAGSRSGFSVADRGSATTSGNPPLSARPRANLSFIPILGNNLSNFIETLCLQLIHSVDCLFIQCSFFQLSASLLLILMWTVTNDHTRTFLFSYFSRHRHNICLLQISLFGSVWYADIWLVRQHPDHPPYKIYSFERNTHKTAGLKWKIKKPEQPIGGFCFYLKLSVPLFCSLHELSWFRPGFIWEKCPPWPSVEISPLCPQST